MKHRRMLEVLAKSGMQDWAELLAEQLKNYFDNMHHGDFPKWQQALDNLPSLKASNIELNSDCINIGDKTGCPENSAAVLEQQLKILMPWRKGPFNLFGTAIDTEWCSNLKWSRLEEHIKPLKDRMVLDVGCGNGYYGWRMLGENARYVMGLDPTLLFYMQFNAIKKYVPDANIDLIPFGIQKLPGFNLNFDTVFSMGVIYHRRDPVEHILQLRNCLRAGGELVLESLIIEGDDKEQLVPDERYAKMKNVWAIPNITTLTNWIEEAGFINVRTVDVTRTSIDEQRRTEWMKFESLSDFLDKEDNTKTIEGYPAPTRAILVAEKP